jgi:hypothetical protein
VGKIILKQRARQIAEKAVRQLALGGGAGHQAIASRAQRRGTLRLKLPGVFENDDAERRLQPKVGLTHDGSERIAELRELAEGLGGWLAAVVADGFEGTQSGFDPLGFGEGVGWHK